MKILKYFGLRIIWLVKCESFGDIVVLIRFIGTILEIIIFKFLLEILFKVMSISSIILVGISSIILFTKLILTKMMRSWWIKSAGVRGRWSWIKIVLCERGFLLIEIVWPLLREVLSGPWL